MNILLGHKYFIILENSLCKVKVLDQLTNGTFKDIYLVELVDTGEIVEVHYLQFSEYLGE